MVRHPRLAGIPAQVGAREMTKEIGINQLKRRDFLKAGLVFGAGAAGLAARGPGRAAGIAPPAHAPPEKRAPPDTRPGAAHPPGGTDSGAGAGSPRAPPP